jgi:hypothetical protein
MRRRIVLTLIFSIFAFSCQKDQSTTTSVEINAKAAMKAFQEKSNVNDQQKNVIQQVPLKMLWDKAFHLSKDSLFVPLVLTDTVYMEDDNKGKVLMNRRMHLIASYDHGWKFTIKALFPDKTSEKYHFSGKVLSTDYFVDDLSYSYFYKGKPLSKKQAISSNGLSTGGKKGSYVKLECRKVTGYVNGQYNNTSTYCTFTHGSGGMDGSGPGEWQMFQPEDSGGAVGGSDSDDISPNYVFTIVNNIKDPCLRKMVEQVIDNDITFTAQNSLSSIFKESPRMNLFFEESKSLIDQNMANTIGRNTAGGMDVTITLNQNVLPGATQEYIAAVIVHEAVHAYLNSKGFNYNTDQHQMMLRDYLFVIAGYLTTTFQTPTQDAYALAFEGMENVFVNELNNATRDKIIKELGTNLPSYNDRTRIRTDYEMGYKGIACQPKM